MLSSMLKRVKVPAVGCLLVAGYFWTGTAAKLWIAERTPGQPIFGDSSLHSRSMRGYARTGLNMPFTRAMGFYGSLATGPLAGPTAGAFLEGLGIGIDAESPDYDARCRAALEKAVAQNGINPWRNHARMELAHLLARPASTSPQSISFGNEEFKGQAWITLGLVDSDRWWLVHEPAGEDPARAAALCEAVQSEASGELVLADALHLKAALAAQHWDFRTQDSLMRDLIESCPTSPLTRPALGILGERLARQGRIADAAGLTRRVLRQLSPRERVQWAPSLADLQAAGEGIPAARATLESALREAEVLARDMGGRRLATNDPRTPLKEALKRLPESTPRQSSSLPARESGPAFPVRSRLLAAGKALPGVSVALLPIPVLAQPLPPPLAAAMTTPRAAGDFEEPEPVEPGKRPRRRQDPNQAWQIQGISSALEQNPSLVARSDAEGNLAWPAVPAGMYGVVLRVGTWELPDEGRNLTITPLPAPVSVSGPATVIPDLTLNTAMCLIPIAADRRPPGLRWKPVPGASTYRVSLLQSQLRWGNAGIQVRCIAAPTLAPEVVWWRDGVQGDSIRLTPEHFTGPAGNALHSGVYRSASYRWSVEARDAAGRVIATAETLAPPPATRLPSWTALQPDATLTSARKATFSPEPGARIIPAHFRGDNREFSSPFLDSLLEDAEPAAPAAPTAKRAAYPTIVSRGQGLPPRAPLAMSSGTPTAGGMPGMTQWVGAPGSAGFPGAMPGQLPPGERPSIPGSISPGALPPGSLPPGAANRFPPGFAGMPPTLPPGIAIRPSVPPGKIAGAAPRPSSVESPATLQLILEAFDTGSPDRWTADRELPAFTGNGLPIAGPLVLTPRDAPLALPPGPGRLSAHLSSLGVEVTAVLLDAHGKATRAKLQPDAKTRSFHTLLAPGEWKLQSLELRSLTGEVRLESLSLDVPPGSGLYSRAWRESGRAWIEITNLGPIPQTVALNQGAVAFTLDLAPRGKARLPLTGEPASPVLLQFSGKRLEVPVRGAAVAAPP